MLARHDARSRSSPGSRTRLELLATAFANVVTADFFLVLGIPVLRGRGFLPGELDAERDVVIVNEAMARSEWPGEDRLKKCIQVGGASAPCRRVIGVVGNVESEGLRGGPPAQFYIPLGRATAGLLTERTLFIRTTQSASRMAPLMQRTLMSALPGLPYLRVQPLSSYTADMFRPWRLGAAIASSLGVLAWLLAGTGLFGLLSHLVAQRRHEIAVRIAVGASPWDVLGLVTRESSGIIAIGAGLGILLSQASIQGIKTILFNVEPEDPLALGAALLVVISIGVLASYLPVRQALRLSPMPLLRAE